MLFLVIEHYPDPDDGWEKIRGIYDSEVLAIARRDELTDKVVINGYGTNRNMYARGKRPFVTFLGIKSLPLNEPISLPWE
jgi:hypothetical protein